MVVFTSEIKIPLASRKGIELCIYGDKKETIKEVEPELAADRGESPYQLLEGHFYNYEFEKDGKLIQGIQLKEHKPNIVNSVRKTLSRGRIAPNIFVGSLELEVIDTTNNSFLEKIFLEVLPTKLNDDYEPEHDEGYQTNYQAMLNDIAEKSAELLLQVDSPVFQNFESDFDKDPQTIYQRFAFLKSILEGNEFKESVQQILTYPTSKWESEVEENSVFKLKRFSNKVVRQIVSKSNRVKLKSPIGGLNSLPLKVDTTKKVETYDTHENRFIKHALETFLQFIRGCEEKFRQANYEKSSKEAMVLGSMLENQLQHPFFSEISKPNVLKLNSPSLQRKGGYREILNIWLKFDLSLRLIWRGSDDIFKGGKRDIATLYEYWLFFKLYDLMVEKFHIEGIEHNQKEYNHLIQPSSDGLMLLVKSGKNTALNCIYKSNGWDFNVRFNYNKTFSGDTKYHSKRQGSWTKPMRPDYTLSIWPRELTESKAEEEEQIVHIHFDSKYKVKHFTIPTTVESEEIDNEEKDSIILEKIDERKGIYKNADLLKMHAYKDAIRRTAGAYILYPGTEEQKPLKGFHEIIPGLGAFAIHPTQKRNDSSAFGIDSLSNFIDEVIANFKNAASQRKKYASKTYQTFKDKPSEAMEAALPYALIPDETFVLVGYVKSKKHLQWITTHNLYNFRIDSKRGALKMNYETLNAKFLLLHCEGDQNSNLVFEILKKEYKIRRKEVLKRVNYPNPTQERYYVIKIRPCSLVQFKNKTWNFKDLKNYKVGRASAIPFTASFREFMDYQQILI